jgi:hypothetical protein
VTTLCERFGWFPPGQDATAVASNQEVREWRDAGAFPEVHVSGHAPTGTKGCCGRRRGWFAARSKRGSVPFPERDINDPVSLATAESRRDHGRVSGFSTENLNAPVLGQRSTSSTRKDRRTRLAAEPSRNGPEVLRGLVRPHSKHRRARVHRVRRGRPSRSSSQRDVRSNRFGDRENVNR